MTKLDSHETKTAFATRVGLTKGRISQLVAEGLPVRADGRIRAVNKIMLGEGHRGSHHPRDAAQPSGPARA